MVSEGWAPLTILFLRGSMMSVDILICSCGMRLKTPGAVPGRVGKCPRCGSLLKVPELTPQAPARLPDENPTFVDRRVNQSPKKSRLPGHSGGLVAGPRMVETHWRESLTYPLWGDAGLAILGFMSVGLWFATVPLFGLVPTFAAGTGLSLFAMIFLLPIMLLLVVIGGQTLGFMGQVLVSSSLGEVVQPRSPGWSLSEIGSTLARWFWALIVGVVVGGAPVVIYWINCGEVDWLDRIVLIDLIIPGLAYAQMALLATLIHESPLAANPFTVLLAIWQVGWSYFWPCVMTGTVLVIVVILFEGVMWLKDPLGQALAFWLFWVAVLYASMLVLRWLGLFCYRHSVILEWFPDRIRTQDQENRDE
jgi:hypothetical protein